MYCMWGLISCAEKPTVTSATLLLGLAVACGDFLTVAGSCSNSCSCSPTVTPYAPHERNERLKIQRRNQMQHAVISVRISRLLPGSRALSRVRSPIAGMLEPASTAHLYIHTYMQLGWLYVLLPHLQLMPGIACIIGKITVEPDMSLRSHGSTAQHC